MGTLAHWSFDTGTCCPTGNFLPTPPVIGRHDLVSGAVLDGYGNFPMVAPGSNYSLKLGDDNFGKEADRARYYIRVPTGYNRFVVTYKYAVVLQDPQHDPADQPVFELRTYDSATGNPVTCGDLRFVAGGALPGFLTTPHPDGDIKYKPWSTGSVDLSDMGGKTVIMDFISGDCGLGVHFGYAYIDPECSFYTGTTYNCSNNPTIDLTAPPGFQSYEWRDITLANVLGNGATISVPTPPIRAEYAVIVTPYPGLGCKDTIIMPIVPIDLKIKIPDDTVICNGSDLLLEVLATSKALPLKYAWSPATGLSCTNCRMPTLNRPTNLAFTERYYVVVTDTAGCRNHDSVDVTVVPEVYSKIAPHIDSICAFEPLDLQDIAVNTGILSHTWSLDQNGFIVSQNGSKATVSWAASGDKRIIVRTTKGPCNSWDTSKIHVKHADMAFFDAKHHICLDEVVNILPTSSPTISSYHWTIDGFNIPDTTYKSPIKLSWNSLGPKNISVTVKTDNGCIAPPYDTFITVHEMPLADLYVPVTDVCMHDTIGLETIEGPKYTYEWTPVLAYTSNNQSKVRAEISRTGYYGVKVSNEWGCQVSDSLYLEPVDCCNVYFPDAFTPNGDGKNDKFRIISAGFHDIYTLMIVNRWGQVLYETSNQFDGWDGTFRGVRQDMGSYFYYLRYTCTDKREIETKGSFLLIR